MTRRTQRERDLDLIAAVHWYRLGFGVWSEAGELNFEQEAAAAEAAARTLNRLARERRKARK